jgi:alpha-tubulin suppressor-like RCC1 family protein
VTVLPDSADVFRGDTLRFNAVLSDAAGNQISNRTVTWSSTDPDVASVDEDGLVLGVGSGSAAIEATADGVSGAAALTVLQLPASVILSPDSFSVVPGETMRFSVTLLGEGGDVLPDSLVSWSSGDVAIARVDAEGQVTAVGSGSTTITANFSGNEGSSRITVATATPMSLVSVWSGHICAVTTGGAAYCWGRNSHGQLGDGSEVGSDSPVAVVSGLTFTSIATGEHHSCGVTSTGATYCWGSDIFGELGTVQPTETCGPTFIPCSKTPLLVDGGHTFAMVSSGENHVCGATTDNEGYCWGNNEHVQLGNDSTTQTCNGPTPCSRTPIRVRGGFEFESMSAFAYGQSCGLSSTDLAYCWGFNQVGVNSITPVRVPGILSFSSIDAGLLHNCGIALDGTAHCWGFGPLGELGDGSQGSDAKTSMPVPVLGGLTFASISSGGFHSCALTTDGAAYCWGLSRAGQLGSDSPSQPCFGDFPCNTTPVPVMGGLKFESIVAGTERTCGITELGSLYCWGWDEFTPALVTVP